MSMRVHPAGSDASLDSIPVPHETANDRLKRRSAVWYWNGLILAVLLHVAALSLWPEMTAADLSRDRPEIEVVMQPEVDVPPAPEEIVRPAAPVVSEAVIDESITIPSTRMEDWRPDQLAPPAAAQSSARDEFVAFAPTMVPPRVLNQPEVERALRQHYPPMLRDVGIGGRVDMLLWLDEDGRIVRAQIGTSSGRTAFDDAALRVVDVMRLSPALNRGSPTRVIVTIPVVFRVDH